MELGGNWYYQKRVVRECLAMRCAGGPSPVFVNQFPLDDHAFISLLAHLDRHAFYVYDYGGRRVTFPVAKYREAYLGDRVTVYARAQQSLL